MSRERTGSRPQVFISHSHADRHMAVLLQRVLEQAGAATFLDQDRIQPADDLPDRVSEGLAWCDALLLIWSADAATSAWVEREWDRAYELRKRIIPYVLDRTPLPDALSNLVFVEAQDQRLSHAGLLGAVFGRDFVPTGATLFPGKWQASMDAFGLVQGTYTLELRPNGQVEGEGGVANSGAAGELAQQMGMSGVLSMRVPVHGRWTYDEGSELLTIEMTTGVVMGQTHSDTIRIHTTGRDGADITGQDLAGRTWKLHRVHQHDPGPAFEEGEEDDGAVARADGGRRAERDRVRTEIRNLAASTKGSPTQAVLLAALCLGAEEKSSYDLGLPVQAATAMMRSQGDEFQHAYRRFVSELEQGGWL